MKQWHIAVLGALVSVLAAALFLSQVDAQAFVHALAAFNPLPVAACIVLLVLGLLARAWRWRVLLDGALDFWRTFHIMNIAYLVNNLLPFRIGELARMYLGTQAHPSVPAFRTLGTVVTERLLDLLAIVLLMTLALAVGPVPAELRAAGAGGAVTALGGFLVLVVLAGNRVLAQRLMDGLNARLPVLARFRLSVLLGHFLDGLTPLANAASFTRILGLTLLSWGISVAAGYILMFAFFPYRDGITQFAVTGLYIASAAFAIAVPAVPGNLGTYELSILLALNAFGYGSSPEIAAAFAVVVHGVNLLVHVGAGMVGFVREGISLQRLSQGVREMRQQSN